MVSASSSSWYAAALAEVGRWGGAAAGQRVAKWYHVVCLFVHAGVLVYFVLLVDCSKTQRLRDTS